MTSVVVPVVLGLGFFFYLSISYFASHQIFLRSCKVCKRWLYHDFIALFFKGMIETKISLSAGGRDKVSDVMLPTGKHPAA